MKKKIIKISCIVFILGLLVTNGWILVKKKEEVSLSVPVKEYVHPLTKDLKKTFTTEGVVIPVNTYEVFFEKGKGSEYTLKVQEGNVIQEGDEILQYDDPQLRAEMSTIAKKKETLEAALDELESEIAALETESVPVSTYTETEETDVSSILHQFENQSNINQKKTEHKRISLQVEELDHQFEKLRLLEEELTVTSKMGGVVTKVNHYAEKDGERVVTIKSDGPLFVKGTISEYDIKKVSPDLKAIVSPFALKNEKLEGIVTEIEKTPFQEPTIDAKQSNYPIYIQLLEENEKVLEGFHTSVEIYLEEKNGVLTVPTHTIMKTDKGKYVFVVENGVLNKRLIKTGLQENRAIEVVNGLHTNEKIVSSPTNKMKDGQTLFMPIDVKQIHKEMFNEFKKEEVYRILVKAIFG
ncbi:HlyD family efflux transporter periplasmic adaptor subunit [Bacillus sp. FJAT-47783]|uniref:efflux RND transporter periplasmic adaptor subunit n=1 Tax=Bacillus sp. FJAT-47783 TaxID=2922712 RepID=UPI001FABB8DF|nr:HlyD family efflux transporter periplasmic adaptor subunit [Bacillus sp. FJAT-47783]